MDEEITIISDKELEQTFTDNAFKIYMQEIGKYPILSVEQQKELGTRYQENQDIEAKNCLINSNLRLVVNVANHYRSRIQHIQILDLIQEGNLGLIRATETYDPSQSAFTTYAIPWIKQKITRALENKENEIRKPNHLIRDSFKYNKLIEKYQKNQQPLPKDEEICQILNISLVTLKKIREYNNLSTISLNQTISDSDNKTELENFIIVENNDYNQVLNEYDENNLFLVLKEILNPFEYYVIYHRLLDNDQKTLEEIASYFNISRERIRQIEAKALVRIKPYMIKDSYLFKKTLNEIKEREKNSFKYLRKMPISPLNIIKYLYLKDNLDSYEKKLYELKLLGRYEYPEIIYATILGVKIEKLKEIEQSLQNKIAINMANQNLFKKFQFEILQEYKNNIFKIDINKKPKVINYQTLKNKYSALNLDEILKLFNDVNYDLTPAEMKLLTKYFVSSQKEKLSSREIEKEINILIFGYRRTSKNVPLEKLYNEYKRVKNIFTEDQQLYLETFVFHEKNYSNSIKKYSYSAKSFFLNKLERSYYRIYEYFENDFNKSNWLEVKDKYSSLFSEYKIKLLDMFYGVNGPQATISEIANNEQEDYLKIHDIIRNARDLAINLYKGFNKRITIDNQIYIPYVLNLNYDFTPETRYVLKLFLVENKSYEEIKAITGLQNIRISNIITDGIRKIDYYRFGIIKPPIITEEELEKIFDYYKDNLDSLKQEIICLKYLQHLENKDIALKINLPLAKVNQYIGNFNKLYLSYQIKNVNLTQEDILKELSRHKSESIWKEKYKILASFCFGIKNEYNQDGLKLTKEELMVKMGYSKKIYYINYNNMLNLLKAQKVGLINPENSYLSRDELDKLLDDVHLPISRKEREIIMYLFELKNYPYKSLEEIALIYHSSKTSIKTMYKRAILNIYKYLNKEIEGVIEYESDIVPLLKYFSISDRNKIKDFYLHHLTYEQLAEKNNITINQSEKIMVRIRNTIYDLINNPFAKKFDFDYYLEAIQNPDLPFKGDLTLAIKIFNLYFGMDGQERLSIPEIKEKLKLDNNSSTLNILIYNLMLSVCKLKDGIKKDKTFTPEQIYNYYINNYSNMSEYNQKIYQDYFAKIQKIKNINNQYIKLNNNIIFDLIKDTYPNPFILETATKEDILNLIKQYDKKLSYHVKKALMERFDIKEREFMNGKELNHVFKLLDILDTRKEEQIESLTLKREKN